MFIGDETAGRNKRDNFPKERANLPLASDGLSVDMIVRVKSVVQNTVRFALLTAKDQSRYTYLYIVRFH